MEASFGQDLSEVRVHTDASADGVARSLGAKAFTVGNDIVFQRGLYSTASAGDRALLAHELAHVLQQRDAAPTDNLSIMPSRSPLESEARRASEGVARREPASKLSTASTQEVHRQEAQVSLGVLDNPIADRIGTAAFGSGLTWKLFREIVRGAVGEVQAESKAGGRIEKILSRFASLVFHPGDIGRLALGFLWGFAKGLVSPITDLWHLIKGAVVLDYQIHKWLLEHAVELLRNHDKIRLRSNLLKARLDALMLEAGQALARFIANPQAAYKDFQSLVDGLIAKAMGKAREAGKSAVQAVFEFYELPWFNFGEKIGYLEGAILVQVLLVAFSAGIGNALSAAGRTLATAGRIGAEVLGSAFRLASEAIGGIVKLVRSLGDGVLSFMKGVAAKLADVFEEIGTLVRTISEGLEPAVATGGKAKPGALLSEAAEAGKIKAAPIAEEVPRPVEGPKVPEPVAPAEPAPAPAKQPAVPAEPLPASSEPASPPKTTASKGAEGPAVPEGRRMASESSALERSQDRAMSLPETATERKSTYAVSETEVGRGVRRRRTTFSRSKGAKTPTAKADPGRVAAHAEEMRMKGIDYELPSHGRDMVGKGGFKGRYHAMHAEKQMIVSSPNQAVAVNRPMCTDCIRFFSKEAAFQGRKQVVSDPFVKREFFPDGSMIEHLRNGQVVQYNPENFAAAFPPGQR